MNFLHTIHPSAIALHLGTLIIHWYGIILASAFIIGFFVALYTRKQKQVQGDHLYNLFLLLVFFGVIGGRLAHVVTEWGYYQSHFSEVVKIWQGGLAFHGVVFAGLITVYLYCRSKKISFWLITDIIVLSVPLMQAIGRWGNYFNQELFGKPTDVAWGIPIDLVNRPVGFEQFSYFHPLFLYESFFDLIIFIILFILFRQNRLKTGRIALLYFILYSVVRFSLDFLRIEPASIGPLSWGQWVSVFLMIGAVGYWHALSSKEGKNKTAIPTSL